MILSLFRYDGCPANTAPGSMAPKVEAACEFVAQSGGIAGIGQLKDAEKILAGEAGTLITQDSAAISWWGE